MISQPIGYLISAITSTSVIITKFIRSVLLSHADLAPVNYDLSDLRLLLKLIKEQPAIPESLQSQTLLVLECCGNALIHIDAVLGKYTGPEQWVTYGRTEMANCRSSIAIFREALALVLDVATLYVSDQYAVTPTLDSYLNAGFPSVIQAKQRLFKTQSRALSSRFRVMRRR